MPDDADGSCIPRPRSTGINERAGNEGAGGPREIPKLTFRRAVLIDIDSVQRNSSIRFFGPTPWLLSRWRGQSSRSSPSCRAIVLIHRPLYFNINILDGDTWLASVSCVRSRALVILRVLLLFRLFRSIRSLTSLLLCRIITHSTERLPRLLLVNIACRA